LNDDKEKAKNFLEGHDFDFAYIHTDGTPFRVNAFYKLGRIAFVMRKIASTPKSIEDL
jgi:Tfp pilus assembly ATPase PilU